MWTFTERLFSKARTRMAAAKSIANLGYVSGAALLGVKLRFREHEVSEVLGDCLEAFISLDPPNVLEIVMPFLVGHDGFLAGMAATSLAIPRNGRADVLAGSFDQIRRTRKSQRYLRSRESAASAPAMH